MVKLVGGGSVINRAKTKGQDQAIMQLFTEHCTVQSTVLENRDTALNLLLPGVEFSGNFVYIVFISCYKSNKPSKKEVQDR